MCMKNVNATMFMCSDTKSVNGQIVSFGRVFDCVLPGYEGGEYYMDGMNVVIAMSVVFGDADTDDCVILNREYEYMVVLSHPESGTGLELYRFSLNIQQSDLTAWGKSFYELMKVIQLPRIYLPKGLGNYALKLLVRPAGVGDGAGWTTQTVHSLVVGCINRAR